MSITLRNRELTAVLQPRGAELSSVVCGQSGFEYMWQADPEVWGRHAPVLFPIVGRLNGGVYRYQGGVYPLDGHGFARDCLFQTVEQSDERVVFALGDSPETRAVYPFRFVLRISYTLEGRALTVDYTVTNPGEAALFFSIGAHPGFRCPMGDGAEPGDYVIEFDQPERAARWMVNSDGLFEGAEAAYLDDAREIVYTPDLFNQDALVFKGLRSGLVSLHARKTGRRVTVECGGWPYLGIWSKPGGAPFICIEPWYGHADYADFQGDLTEKEGIQALGTGEEFTCSHRIVFD